MDNLIGKRIKDAMQSKGIKQSDIVKKTGINKGALSSYISGKYLPKQTNLYKIAKVLDVDPAWLMGYNTSNNSLNEFLEKNKLVDIENIVSLDKQHKLIKLIDFMDIVLYIYSPFGEKMYSLINEMNFNTENLEQNSNDMKKYKFFYEIKKHYNENDVLEEIDNRNIFEILDKEGKEIDKKEIRYSIIKKYLDKILEFALGE